MKDQELMVFLNSWSKRKIIDRKSFDDIFQIGSVPIWWFYRRYFFEHSMPSPINTFKDISKESSISLARKIKFSLSEKLLAFYLFQNEMAKLKSGKPKQRSAKKNKVLLLSYSNHLSKEGKIFRLEEVINELKKSKELSPFPIFIDPLSRKDHKKIVNLANVYDYYEDKLYEKAEVIAKDFAIKWKRISKKVKKDMLKDNSKDLWQYLCYAFDFFFSKPMLLLLVLYYEIFKKIIEEEKIKAAVITSSNGLFDKCLIAASKKEGIPIIRIDHGIMYDIGRDPELIGKATHAVMSKRTKEELKKLGVKEGDIAIVGPVMYDEIVKHKKKKSKHEKNIFICTAPMVETSRISKKEYFIRIKKIIDDLNKIKGAKIALKLHPMELYYKDYLALVNNAGYKNVDVYPPNIAKKEFYGLMSRCDVFIQFGSNSAIEAMILKKPVININILDFHMKSWLDGIGGLINTDYKKNLKEIVENSFKQNAKLEKEQEEVVKKYLGNVDGKASKRVVELIRGLIK